LLAGWALSTSTAMVRYILKLYVTGLFYCLIIVLLSSMLICLPSD